MKAAIFGVLGLLSSASLLAQDGHYWTQQYGTRSMLMSGSVIGSTEDLAAVYYNPGRLSIISNAAFLLSANVYEYNSISVSDAFGNSKNANKSTIKGVPTLAAGTFHLKFLPKHYFAYAVLTRQSSDVSFNYRNETHSDVIASLPGDEYFGANVSVTNKGTEQWTGITWSYPVSPKISVGVTGNYSTNNQSRGSRIDLQALSAADQVALYRYNRNYTYKQNGLIWKAGIAANLAKWQLGMTVTTPLIHMSSKGTYTYEEFFSSIPGLTPKPETYTTSYQTGLKATYKTPWSVGAGGSRAFGRSKLHFSAEWFSAIPSYSVMQALDHNSQSNPATVIQFHLMEQAKTVTNAGLGAEIYISDRVSGFASFSTDFTSVTGDITRFIERQSTVSNSTWNTNFYHEGGGIVLKLRGADITLGATHTGAQMTLPRPVTFPDNSGQNVFSPTETANLKWERWRMVFSFSFPFLKDYAKKVEDKLKN